MIGYIYKSEVKSKPKQPSCIMLRPTIGKRCMEKIIKSNEPPVVVLIRCLIMITRP